MYTKTKIKNLISEISSSQDTSRSKLTELLKLLSKHIDHPHNFVLLADAYKYSHHKFYPEGMTEAGSYMESRGGKFPKTLVYGIQGVLKKYFTGVVITKEDVEEAYEYLGDKYGVFGRDDVFDRTKFDYIVEKHGGKLPLRIKAVPEGTVLSTKNVLIYVEATDPNCTWLVNFIETLLHHVWYPITVATLSMEVRKVARTYWEKTTDHSPETIDFLLDFVLNDFGFRGVTCVEQAEIGGSAHLVNFQGSDTTVASKFIREYYNTDNIRGKSVPATEHSIMTLFGKEGEVDMMRRVLEKYPTGIVACVSDTYGIKHAVKNLWGKELKAEILSRPNEPGNQLVIRPDSGHVINTLKIVFESLFESFGYTVNKKGYKVLPPQVRVIQGDGVNLESIRGIYEMLVKEGISAENIVFGMGGKLLQSGIDRDLQNFATKVCYAVIDGVVRNVVKSPVEIDENFDERESFKKSKQGIPKLIQDPNNPNEFITVTSIEEGWNELEDLLVPIFENGELLREYTFEEVCLNAKKWALM
jgi:nicotinamide phosphoribosyltransferase